MAYEPINRRQVVEALREFGSMNRYELAEHLGWDVAKVGTTIASTRWLLPEKVFRIVSYKDAVHDGRLRQVAVFDAQAGADVARPSLNSPARRKKTQARYRDKNRAGINAKHRTKRAKDIGLPPVVNPWLHLAPPNLRAAMSQRSLPQPPARH